MSRLFPFAFLLVVFLIAGAYLRSIATEPATPASEQAVAVSRTPTVTALVTLPAAPTATPTATITPSPTLSSTPLPDPTRTATATATVTPTATNTRFPTPTPDPDEYNYRVDLPAPNGQWVAIYKQGGIGPFPERVILTITNLESQKEIIVENLVEGDEPIYRGPFPLLWSADSQTLYYNYSPTYGDGCLTYNKATLHSYHLPTGTYQTLLERMGEGISFSPNLDRVAYFPQMEQSNEGGIPSIAILELQDGTLRESPLHDGAVILPARLDIMGRILWHPDGQRLAISMVAEPCIRDRPALLLLDTTTLDQQVIVAGGPTEYYPDAWEDGNTLLLHDSMNRKWRYSPESGYWSQIFEN